ncbi:ammonium transporter [Anaeromyxobacter oryzae]|uniref:Ammonium transporter n=1 Tax=Anaeromyxobacter oryzae TaxID=2918170 RepID=A0ABM7X1B5_9BACT|nr:ammonium transporter [Anaeromyxobacter oryzae]BDG05531.1 ammonium transporter [Anaeromyxobacter oryzae]
MTTALDTGNTAWVLTATGLVLFMTLPGLALFYGGLVRTKNVLSVLMQCFSIASVVTVLWVAVGYSLAFTPAADPGLNGFIGGLGKAFLANVPRGALTGSIPETVFAMFQLTFAIITPALIIGAFAERVSFGAMLLFMGLWSLVVYVPVTHWMWGGGWLQRLGALDYAGGIVVHVTAGIAGLVACLYVGKRKGYPTTPMPPHSLTLSVVGAGMLWVGWFGFNAGSALAANGIAGMTLTATQVSAATAAMVWSLIEWQRHGRPSVLGIITGAVAGLATVTPASGYVGVAGAMAIGAAAAVVCFFSATTLKRRLGYDDSLDAFGVHGVGGLVGSILTGVFASVSLGGTEQISIGRQLGVQLLACAVTAAWSGGMTWVLFKVADLVVGVRVDDEQESVGLDLSDHEERGYDLT